MKRNKLLLLLALLMTAATGAWAQTGMTKGSFSVSATKRVHFSKGNLQWVGENTFQFAENQWDVFGSSQSNGHRDLFGWGSANNPNLISENNNDYSTFTDWGTKIGDGTTWRTLTNDEWYYVLNTRTASTLNGTVNARYAYATVNGVGGLILFPDNYTHPGTVADPAQINTPSNAFNANTYSANTYDVNAWAAMEDAGAVFLPHGGCRTGTLYQSNQPNYWSSTPISETLAHGLNLSPMEFKNWFRFRGCAVRLVTDEYVVTMKDGVKDADKWTASTDGTNFGALPIGGLKGDAVTLTYGGRLKVKGVKATSAPSVPDGAINGKFSVSDTKKVNFSKGNLQAVCTSADNNPSYPETFTWQFAENQWDCIGADNNKVNGNGLVSSNCTIDVFGWSTSSNNFGIHNSKTDGDYSGDFVDWGTAIGSGWRTLTHDEWNFLLQSRTTTSGLLFAKANLLGTVHGLILFPDNYTHPDGLAAITAPNDATGNAGWNGNQYTAEEWAKMEAAGAVFLPAAGCREETTNQNLNVIGYYHTATPANANNSYDFAFHASALAFDYYQPNHWAFSVRLVYDVE